MCSEKFLKFHVSGLQFSLKIVLRSLPFSNVMGWYPLVEVLQKLQLASTEAKEIQNTGITSFPSRRFFVKGFTEKQWRSNGEL